MFYLLITENPWVKYIDYIVIIWYSYMATIVPMLWLAVFLQWRGIILFYIPLINYCVI